MVDASPECARNQNDSLGELHSVHWWFQAEGTVAAEGFWSGQWRESGQNTISVTIRLASGATDAFAVLFVTANRFVAVKGRLGLSLRQKV